MKNILAGFVKWYKLIGLYVLRFFKKYYPAIIMAVVSVVALIVRYCFVMFPSGDTVWFIIGNGGWWDQVLYNGFKGFWDTSSDYSPAYMFLLALLTFIPDKGFVTTTVYGTTYQFYESRMVAIKTIYFVFTFAAAFGIYLLVKLLTNSKPKAAIGYCITLALPTLFLNSTVWGNSDVMYVAFMIYAIYFFLKGTKFSDLLGYMFLGFALANKMQTIFLLPFVVYLIFRRKIKIYRALVFPIAFFSTLIPAWICGASFAQSLDFMGSQYSGQPSLSLGAATIWKFLELQDSQIVRDNAMWISLLLLGTLFVIIYFRNIKLDDKNATFKVMFLFTMVTAFVLPRLHERYFLVLEILLIPYAIKNPKRWYLPILAQVAGAFCYYHYLTGYQNYLIPTWGEANVTVASGINLVIIGIVFVDVFKLDHKDGFKQDVDDLTNEIQQLREQPKAEEAKQEEQVQQETSPEVKE